MIFHLSQSLNAKVKTGILETCPLHEKPLLDWSAHLFSVTRSQFILVSNTWSLFSVVVPGKGVMDSKSFQAFAFEGIRACMTAHGYESLRRTIFSEDNRPVRFAKALNRSVTGSVNELTKCAELFLSEGDLVLSKVADQLNETLLSSLAQAGKGGYGKPREVFQAMLE